MRQGLRVLRARHSSQAVTVRWKGGHPRRSRNRSAKPQQTLCAHRLCKRFRAGKRSNSKNEMNAEFEVSTLVARPEAAPAEEGQHSANRLYPAYISAAVCAFGADAKPLPATLVDISIDGAGIEVHGGFEALSFWLRFDWREWECCFECRSISTRPVGQGAFVQARFAGLNGEDLGFLRGMVDSLGEQFEALQQRMVRPSTRRLHDLRASVEDGSYRPDSNAVARDFLNQVTRSTGRNRR